jgi:hypothetical protein
MKCQRRSLSQATFHFYKNIRGSDISKPGQGHRGQRRASRNHKAQVFPGMRRGRRLSASRCGNPFGFSDEGRMPGRCFRKSPRRPPRPIQAFIPKKKIKSEVGKRSLSSLPSIFQRIKEISNSTRGEGAGKIPPASSGGNKLRSSGTRGNPTDHLAMMRGRSFRDSLIFSSGYS